MNFGPDNDNDEGLDGPPDDYYGDDPDLYGYDEYDQPQKGPPPLMGKRPFNDFRNARYIEAYGNYRGGYGPGGGFGPPMPPGPPPPFWGGGFGPGGPSPRRPPRRDYQGTIKYLMRCGVPKEHLKNLPNNLLKLYDPYNCGLCAMALDNFTSSKMHYISRNHLKNQKKWLSMNPRAAMKNKETMPMKAREMYCELCDVQMTSKSHADAHYSGKPHAAIVLGRKKPKNPLLNQKAMEDRLQQLIRREKKFINAANPAQASAEADTKSKETKNAPPELTCVICNTVVTCSEQMTMHMNGKRHLSKEKQYILKQMKGANAQEAGEAAEDNDVTMQDDEGNQDDEGDQDDAPDNNEGNEKADEDWGEPWESDQHNEGQQPQADTA